MSTAIIRSEHKALPLVIAIYLLVTIPLVFLGYGSDNDTYGVLDAGLRTWEQNKPSMSRHPGYWLYEALVYVINGLGGSLATNISTLLVSLFILRGFYSILEKRSVTNRALITLCLALNPYFLIAATSTMDHIWALALIAVVMQIINRQRMIAVGLVAGLAIGMRLSSAIAVFGIIIGSLVQYFKIDNVKRLFFIGLMSLVLGGLFYVPSWIRVGENFKFLAPHLGDDGLWTLKMHIGRAIYKPIYLFGLLSFVVIIGITAFMARYRKISLSDTDVLVPAICGAVSCLALFAAYPLKMSYLLPFLFFSYLAFGLLFRECPKHVISLLLMSVVSYSFISFPLAKPDTPDRARYATIGFSMERGVLLSDIGKRQEFLPCKTKSCWEENTQTVSRAPTP
jgi:MFS family permease